MLGLRTIATIVLWMTFRKVRLDFAAHWTQDSANLLFKRVLSIPKQVRCLLKSQSWSLLKKAEGFTKPSKSRTNLSKTQTWFTTPNSRTTYLKQTLTSIEEVRQHGRISMSFPYKITIPNLDSNQSATIRVAWVTTSIHS